MKDTIDDDQITTESPARSLVSVDLEITPLKKHGKELVCAINGSIVNGGVIELDSSNTYTLNFQLLDGNAPGLNFATETDYPFCSITDDCPKKGDQIDQFPSVTSNGKTLTVIADPGIDPIVHYALRFEDTNQKILSWDPIIINN